MSSNTEVKELARQTATAADEISRQIQAMQSDTGTAVKAINAVAELINDVNTISQTIVSAVEEQSATIGEIAHSVSGASIAASSIANNVNQTADGLSEVAQNISGIDSASRETARGVAQIAKSSEELSRLSSSLSTLVSRFKV